MKISIVRYMIFRSDLNNLQNNQKKKAEKKPQMVGIDTFLNELHNLKM